MPLDLIPEHLEMVQRILSVHVPDCEVRAYGSRVKGDARKYSDLDLTIVGSKPIDQRRIAELRYAFDESDLPIRVDVHDWHRTSQTFQKIIEQSYVVVHSGVAKSF